MRVIAVPVKSLDRAKSRLSEALGPIERAALTLAMLEDVLDACMDLPGWTTWVISPDQSVLEVAARRRAHPVKEETPGLVAAVRQVEEEIGRADALAVVLGDLPLLTPEGLSRVLHTLGPVVLAPSSAEDGTNVLLRRPPGVIAPQFGRESFRRHREAAELRGIPSAVVRGPELSFDLDHVEDLSTLLASSKRSRTKAACLEMGLPGRLELRAHS